MGRARTGGFLCLALVALTGGASADVPLGGFIPYVGIGLTDEFETFDTDPDGTFFIADQSTQWGGSPLGPGASAYFDLALLDTGAATHILTPGAASATGFGIQAEGFRGTNFQTIFGASGSLDLRIDDPLGVYATGLANRTGSGPALNLNTATMRGQTSFAMLEGPAEWELPNVIGLPMAAQHAISIRNDQPQIFQHQGRTVRSPNVNLLDLGGGSLESQQQGIVRRTDLRIRPSASFLSGPLYVQNLDIGAGLEFHNNPLSPSVIDSGALFLEVDAANSGRSFQDKEFLFDTGADISVVSELTAARLGFDIALDEPDFFLEVEGAGGVTEGVPGFYLDELNLDAVGGSLRLENVPVAVINLPNPNDPANVVDGILGMHLFTGRNLIIDANPAPNQVGRGPSLYISDPVTQIHTWASPAAVANWSTASSWSAAGAPGIMWDAQVRNASGVAQTAAVSSDSQVYRLTVAGAGPAAGITVSVNQGATLLTYGETLIESGGTLELQSNGVQSGRLDAQFVNIEGGALTGAGDIFVGTGPVTGVVRNLSGRVSPHTTGPLPLSVGRMHIIGDFANLEDGTLAIDLGGAVAGAQHDQLAVDRFAFLAGTLEVKLTGFTPSVGNMFTIITAGEGISGQFDNLVLPSGFQWSVDYLATSVVLKVAAMATLPGDFDANGNVDAVDLAVWKAGFGTIYDGDDFLAWQRNFGAGGPVAPVPEPAGASLLLAAACGIGIQRRRRRR